MKNPFRRAINNTALVTRSNVGPNLYQSDAPINVEALWEGSTRYCDPLIRDHVIDKGNATHRERVSNEDPFGILVTRVFACMAFARAPKFYASDEQGAPEIMQDVRAVLTQLKAWELCTEACKDVLTHGHVETYMWLDQDENETPSLISEVYSAMQITPADITRDDLNHITAWLVRGRYPPVPTGYTTSNLKTIKRQFAPGQDGLIVHTRGDFNKSLGYGYSRLVQLWDPITKLRVTSHSDAKRNEIFPLVVYPSSWEVEDVDALFESLAHVDENAGLAIKSAEDAEGSPVPGLPSIAWRTPAEDAPNVSGEGGPRGLPSEIVRFCALSGITIKELSGDPGGAQEAGATDIALALEKNIQEFNYSCRPFLEKLILQLAKWGLQAPPTFVIKGHWEWERDEALMAQATLQDEQMDIEHDKAEKKPAKNAAPLFFPYQFDLVARTNAVPGVMAPIASSWVKSYGYDQDNFYMQFHGAGSTIFKYPYTDDPAALASGIEMSGSPGGFVHDDPELGVPRRTPYSKETRLPSSMAWAGDSQAGVEYESRDARDEKMGMFGTKRPARSPNQANYPQQTAAQSEQTTGPIRGPGAFDLGGVQAQIRQAGKPGQVTSSPVVATSSAGAFGTAQSSATPVPGVGRPEIAAGGTLSGELPLGMLQKGHEGKKKQGKKITGLGGTQTGGVDYSTLSTAPYSYNAAIPVRRINANVADLSFEQWQQLSKAITGQGMGETTIDKIRKILPHVIQVSRQNRFSRGNTMSFKDHPYRYVEPDGTISTEYPCSLDWRKNVVGKTKALKINAKNPDEHGDTIIGTITYGWNDELGIPDDVSDYDPDTVMAKLRENHQEGSMVYQRLLAGEDPDYSTEYLCTRENHAGKVFQRDFVAGDTCLVNIGNCPSGECDLVPL